MDYETANYLKEYGYPQTVKRGYFIVHENQRDQVYIPEMEELMNECGPEFESIHKVYGEDGFFWRVIPKDIKTHDTTTGPTPRMALAKFFLQINKRQDNL